jgi:hypothetical protein
MVRWARVGVICEDGLRDWMNENWIWRGVMMGLRFMVPTFGQLIRVLWRKVGTYENGNFENYIDFIFYGA